MHHHRASKSSMNPTLHRDRRWCCSAPLHCASCPYPTCLTRRHTNRRARSTREATRATPPMMRTARPAADAGVQQIYNAPRPRALQRPRTASATSRRVRRDACDACTEAHHTRWTLHQFSEPARTRRRFRSAPRSRSHARGRGGLGPPSHSSSTAERGSRGVAAGRPQRRRGPSSVNSRSRQRPVPSAPPMRSVRLPER